MGRERKPQGGNFNKSASGRTGPPPGSGRSQGSKLEQKPAMVKFKPTSLVETSKNKFLDLPPEDTTAKDDVYVKKKRDVSGSSCWRGTPITPRQYHSDYSTSFRPPSSQDFWQPEFKVTKPPGAETERRSKQLGAMEKFMRVAKSRYGSVSKMFLVFKKTPGDYFTFSEFADNINRRAMDVHFPQEDQKLVFEKFEKVHGGKGLVEVDDILEYVVENAYSADVPKRDSSEVTCALFEQLANARKLKKANLTAGKLRSAVHANLTKAWGDDFSDIIKEDKVEALVAEMTASVVDKRDKVDEPVSEAMPGTKEYAADEKLDGVIKYLSTAAVDLSRVPFLDNKSDVLRNLKNQADRLKTEIRESGGDGNGLADQAHRLGVRNTIDIVYTPRHAKDLNSTLQEHNVDSKTLYDLESTVKELKKIQANAHVPLSDRQAKLPQRTGPGYDEFHELGEHIYDKERGQLKKKSDMKADALDIAKGSTIGGIEYLDFSASAASKEPESMKRQKRIETTEKAIDAVGMLPIVATKHNIAMTQLGTYLNATLVADRAKDEAFETTAGDMRTALNTDHFDHHSGGELGASAENVHQTIVRDNHSSGKGDLVHDVHSIPSGLFNADYEQHGVAVDSSPVRSPKGVKPSPLHGSQAVVLTPLSSPAKDSSPMNSPKQKAPVRGSPRLQPLSNRDEREARATLEGLNAVQHTHGHHDGIADQGLGVQRGVAHSKDDANRLVVNNYGTQVGYSDGPSIDTSGPEVGTFNSTQSAALSSPSTASNVGSGLTPGGRRRFPQPELDWGRVGYGGDAIPSNSPMYMGTEDRMTSTSAKAFPALVYEPSKPPRRVVEMVSDAQVAVDKKKARFNAFKTRSDANKAVTANRLEYEEFQRSLRKKQRELNKAHDMIRYKSDVLLLDLVRYKKQPMQRMSKKGNVLSTKMWGGSVVIGDNDRSRPIDERKEDRDFLTTYGAEFQPRDKEHFHPDHDHHYTSTAEFPEKHMHDHGVSL